MNYLITFDQSVTNPQTQVELHGVLTSLPGISDWWHYIGNVYIVVSNQQSGVISDYIFNRIPTLRFLIINVSLDDANGVLQKDAWDWINKHKTQVTPLKTILKANANQTTSLPLIPQGIFPYLGPSLTSILPDTLLSDIFKTKK